MYVAGLFSRVYIPDMSLWVKVECLSWWPDNKTPSSCIWLMPPLLCCHKSNNITKPLYVPGMLQICFNMFEQCWRCCQLSLENVRCVVRPVSVSKWTCNIWQNRPVLTKQLACDMFRGEEDDWTPTHIPALKVQTPESYGLERWK